jgi:hypothetical protein
MAPALMSTIPKDMGTSNEAGSGFRLGDSHLSDASDGDQSAHSERSLSPSKATTQATKSKKRRHLKEERRKVGALTDDLDLLLGAAFQAPDSNAEKTPGM